MAVYTVNLEPNTDQAAIISSMGATAVSIYNSHRNGFKLVVCTVKINASKY